METSSGNVIEEQLTAIQQLINTAIEFCVNYSFRNGMCISSLSPRMLKQQVLNLQTL